MENPFAQDGLWAAAGQKSGTKQRFEKSQSG